MIHFSSLYIHETILILIVNVLGSAQWAPFCRTIKVLEEVITKPPEAFNIDYPQRKANYTHQMTMIMVINIAFTDLLNGLFSASFNAANLFKEEYPMPEPQVSNYQ